MNGLRARNARRLLAISLAACPLSAAVRAATYYVDTDSVGGACSDSNPGTLSQPWRTLAKANAALVPGDTVRIRAGVYTNDYIRPAGSGTSETARIAYRAHDGETVTLRQTAYAVRLDSKSYITVAGIRFSDCPRNLYLSASHHNAIEFCRFDNPAGPATWAGSRLYSGSQSNRIVNCTFSRYGSETYYSDSYQDYGCNLDIGSDASVDPSDYNLIASNTFFHGGHHILGVYANRNVVRHNTFHNEEWYPCHRTDIGGLCGNRCVILNSSQPDNNIRNIIENNAIVFSGVPPDQVSSAGLSVRTRYNIVRRNIFYDCDGAGLALSVDSGNLNDASENYIYHNVFYKNGYLLLDDWNPRKCGLMLARWVNDPAYNAMTHVAIKNNIFHDNQLYAVYYYYVDPAEQFATNNWEHAGDPRFIDLEGPADPFDFGVFDFHLQPDSPCIDNGGFLTRTTGAGTNSAILRVENAGYFTDGMGVIEADRIQLEGQPQTAAVVAIDYAANTLTLDAPRSWSTGIGVSLPYAGARPDQGAYEYTPAPAMPARPTNLRVRQN
ncbi:MAG: right-handed parallel beta-helix repeat-containing protein [Kiritimatiellae bacterium]|nr:right-handed parallel beta-helix repeat-containing protein [Kiritimatiellia bacterium]